MFIDLVKVCLREIYDIPMEFSTGIRTKVREE